MEKPAKVGDWVQATRYSAQDKRNHVVYYRITGVKRGDDVEKTIRAWNEADHITKFQDIKDDDLEYCSFTYDVYFPEDYPEAEWGITSASLSFSVTDKDGGGITDENGTSYIGLSSVHDVSATVENNTLHAGDTFHGESVYAMVKSVHDYVFEIGIPQSRRL